MVHYLKLSIMNPKEALKNLFEILDLEEQIRYEEEREERIALRKEIVEIQKNLSEFLASKGYEGADWDDSVTTMVACGLSPNQANFILRAQNLNMEVISYSGRGMYGDRCPAVVGDHFGFEGLMYTDNMGLDLVFYAKN